MCPGRAFAQTVILAIPLTVAACGDDASAPSPSEAASVDSKDAIEAKIAVVRLRIEANNAKDWDRWEKLHTEDAVRTAPELDEPLQGAQAMRAAIEELLVTFPDYHLELIDAFGSGDRLVATIHTRATMLGPLPFGDATLPATGKAFEQDWIAVLRFEGGLIAAIDEFHDNYGILVQLGLTGEQ